jgi:hypothetical protein
MLWLLLLLPAAYVIALICDAAGDAASAHRARRREQRGRATGWRGVR